jgi:hypothetical protein
MDISALIVVIALALIVGASIARPLLLGGMRVASEAEEQLSVLEAERDRILAALQELELDFKMGKILPEHYRTSRREWVAQGVRILRQIDRLSGGERDETGQVSASAAIEMELEAAVARLRGAGWEAASAFCSRCGAALIAGDRFCSRCGSPVEAAAGS